MERPKKVSIRWNLLYVVLAITILLTTSGWASLEDPSEIIQRMQQDLAATAIQKCGNDPYALLEAAAALSWSGNEDGAGEILKHIISLLSKPQRFDHWDVFTRVTRIITTVKDTAKASELLKQALTLVNAPGSDGFTGIIHISIAQAYVRLQKFDEAKGLLKQALTLLDSALHHGRLHGYIRAYVLVSVATMYSTMRDSVKSNALLNQALTLVDKPDKILSRFQSADFAEMQSSLFNSEPESQSDSAIAIRDYEMQHDNEKVNLLTTFANAYLVLCDSAKASDFLMQAVAWVDTTRDAFSLERALQSIVNTSSKLRDSVRASEILEQVFNVVESLDDDFKAIGLARLAEAYARMKNTDRAIELLTQAIPLAARIDFYLTQRIAMSSIVASAGTLRDRSRAEEILKQTLQMTDSPSGGEKAILLSTIAEAYLKLGDYDRTRTLLAQALPLADDDYHRSDILSRIAPTYAKLGDLQAAQKLVEEADDDRENVVAMSRVVTAWIALNDSTLAKGIEAFEEYYED